jgi:hypothetical protein
MTEIPFDNFQAIHEGMECKQYKDLIQTSLRSGKTLEEAQGLILSKAANGWDQMVGTVAGWVAKSDRKIGVKLKLFVHIRFACFYVRHAYMRTGSYVFSIPMFFKGRNHV